MTTYYATPTDIMRVNGTQNIDDWQEVKIIGKLALDSGEVAYLVEKLDGSKRFTVLERYLFEKVVGDGTNGKN
jgi:hypothetical protein